MSNFEVLFSLTEQDGSLGDVVEPCGQYQQRWLQWQVQQQSSFWLYVFFISHKYELLNLFSLSEELKRKFALVTTINKPFKIGFFLSKKRSNVLELSKTDFPSVVSLV